MALLPTLGFLGVALVMMRGGGNRVRHNHSAPKLRATKDRAHKNNLETIDGYSHFPEAVFRSEAKNNYFLPGNQLRQNPQEKGCSSNFLKIIDTSIRISKPIKEVEMKTKRARAFIRFLFCGDFFFEF